VTEVEQAVRESVERTGGPVLLPPPDARYSLHALPHEGGYILTLDGSIPPDDDDFDLATGIAFSTVREWKVDPEGVTLDGYARRVTCTALGLSLLQLAANIAGTNFALQLGA
jgi:hypothetical protein